MLLLSNCCQVSLTTPLRMVTIPNIDWQTHFQKIVIFFYFGRSFFPATSYSFHRLYCFVFSNGGVMNFLVRPIMGIHAVNMHRRSDLNLFLNCVRLTSLTFLFSLLDWTMYGNDMESRCSRKMERHALRRCASVLLFKGERPQYSSWWVMQLNFTQPGGAVNELILFGCASSKMKPELGSCFRIILHYEFVHFIYF